MAPPPDDPPCAFDAAAAHRYGLSDAPARYAHGGCPFLRPWESCAFDDPQRAAQVARRRYHSLLRGGSGGGGDCPSEFDAADFKRTMAGRMLLLVGDSVQTQLFASLACLLYSHDPRALEGQRLAWRGPSNLRKRCRGFGDCHYMHGCAFFSGGFRLCLCFVVNIGGTYINNCIKTYNYTQQDVMVYGSIGVHYRELAKFYGQRPDFAAKAEAKAILNAMAPERQRGYLIFREVSAQHFNAPGGHFNLKERKAKGIGDYNRWQGNATCSSDHTLTSMQEHHRWNYVTVPAMEAAGVPVLRSWRPSSLAWDAHVGYGDCTHFCLPGVPDDWSLQLYALVKHAKLPQLNHSQAHARTRRGLHARMKHERQWERDADARVDWKSGRPAAALGSSGHWSCPMTVPADLTLPTGRPRPLGLRPWSEENMTAHTNHPDLFSPIDDSPQGNLWADAIRASQNPPVCGRYLLIEDDSSASGFGIDGRLYAFALLYAMRKGRVLLHVASSKPEQPYAHLLTKPPTGRWCDRPPYTYDCMWEPLSYCDPPDASLPVSIPRIRYPYDKPDDKAAVARITSKWMWKSMSLWQRGHYISVSGAYRYIFRPRQWVRDIADCLMQRDHLSPRQYIGFFLRISADKAKELKDSLPSVEVYAQTAHALLLGSGMRHVFVSTASASALHSFQQRLEALGPGLYTVSHTENPRSEGDTEVHKGGSNANWTMSMGTVAAVNLLVNSQAAMVVSLAASTWTTLQRELHGGQPPWERSLLTARCVGSRQYLVTDIHASISWNSTLSWLQNNTAYTKASRCHWGHHHQNRATAKRIQMLKQAAQRLRNAARGGAYSED